ncbi:MAG: hypothetical protein ACLP5H_27790 [Desulfomonilaceae bacterium]
MKSKSQPKWTALASVFLVLMAVLVSPSHCLAGDSSWWGSSAWWDWSDFRGGIGARVFLARLASATLTKGGRDFDLRDEYGFSDAPEPFTELWGIFYIDRLGLHFSAEGNNLVGQPDPIKLQTLGLTVAGLTGSLGAELQFSSSRLGLDLDLIRYPFFRFGIEYDYYLSQVKFLDYNAARYTGVSPMTLGFYTRAIPGHIREVPFTVQARFRFPMPLVNRQAESKITDWEISGGLRPAVWETSLYGHATFSFDIEAGFRSVSLDANPQKTTPGNFITTDAYGNQFLNIQDDGNPDVNLKARWQGAFLQVGMFF